MMFHCPCKAEQGNQDQENPTSKDASHDGQVGDQRRCLPIHRHRYEDGCHHLRKEFSWFIVTFRSQSSILAARSERRFRGPDVSKKNKEFRNYKLEIFKSCKGHRVCSLFDNVIANDEITYHIENV